MFSWRKLSTKKMEDQVEFGKPGIFGIQDQDSIHKYVKKTNFFFCLEMMSFFSITLFILSFGIIASGYSISCDYKTKNPAQQKSFNLYCRNHFVSVIKIHDFSHDVNTTVINYLGNAEEMNYFMNVSFIVLFEQAVVFYTLIVAINYSIDMIIKFRFGKKKMADIFVPCQNQIEDILICKYAKCYQIVKELKIVLLCRAALEALCVIFVILHMVLLDYLFDHEYFLMGINVIRNYISGSGCCSNIFPHYVSCKIGGFDGGKTAGYTSCHVIINGIHQWGFILLWVHFVFLILYGLYQIVKTAMCTPTHTCNLVKVKELQVNMFADVGGEIKEVKKYKEEKPPLDKSDCLKQEKGENN